MNRMLLIVLCLCIFVCLSACIADSRTGLSSYDEGYHAGYEAGLMAGISEASEDIAREALSKYQDLEGKTTKERGLHPEEAIIALNDYLDGEYVSKDELRTAIRSISYFYYHAWDIIRNIEYIEVYFE